MVCGHGVGRVDVPAGSDADGLGSDAGAGGEAVGGDREAEEGAGVSMCRLSRQLIRTELEGHSREDARDRFIQWRIYLDLAWKSHRDQEYSCGFVAADRNGNADVPCADFTDQSSDITAELAALSFSPLIS
ncbi:hypothetical protein THIOKS13300008 [Thiocapsa sp. KS1]|nr:hypothetical protein THIOKS13300008 [Thiocapsa sp. KS1]